MSGRGKAKTVDDLLSGAILDGDEDSDVEAGPNIDPEESDLDDESEIADDESFASLDEEGTSLLSILSHYNSSNGTSPDEGAAHAMDLAALQKKDPEFYKYLQENDQELLAFDASEAELSSGEDEDGDEDEHEDAMDEDKEEESPLLTTAILKEWQKSLIEVRFPSARSTRFNLTLGHYLDPLSPRPSTTAHSFPVCGIYER